VVDLGAATVTVKEFRAIVDRIAADTGSSSPSRNTPQWPGAPEEEHAVTLVGRDKSGIIAAITEKLGTYNINIGDLRGGGPEEFFSWTSCGDISRSALPTDNLKAAIRDTMRAVGIDTMFQTEDVFNKKKKVILFDISGSFMDSATLGEVTRQAGIDARALSRSDAGETDLAYMHRSAAMLEGLPASVIETLMQSVGFSMGTRELVQTLRIMGYRIGLITSAFSFFAQDVQSRLGIDYAFGYELPMDDDSQAVIGDLPAGLMQGVDRARIIADVMAKERVEQEDITVISDGDPEYPATPGIRIVFDLKVMLELLNQHALSRESLTGLLRGFGIPRI
jgi:phosphoserine phosphatase